MSVFWFFGRFFDYFFLSSKVSKMKFNQKSLIYKNTTLYDIDFYQKIRILRFFLRKFLLTVFRHYFIKNTPQISLSKFWKNRLFDIPQYPWYIFDTDILRHRFSNNQTIRILLIKIEKLESVYLCFWSIFHRLFFLSSKVSKNRNLIKNTLIYKNTTLYQTFDARSINQTIRILRIFFKKLMSVYWLFWSNFFIIFFIVLKFHKMKFDKNRLFDIPQYIIYCLIIEFYARSNNSNYCEFSDKKVEKLESVFSCYLVDFLIIFFYRPKFQKWNLIKNPWYTKILHCTTLIFIKKLEFCDFF